MSNQLVGTVYQSIIDEVINSSRIDFEEAGINVSTLEDLKQVWQSKLSGLKIAHFPWDPAPEAPQPNVTAAQARAAQHQHQHQQHQQQQQHLHQQQMQQHHQQQMQHHQQHQQQHHQQQGQPHIKSEPGLQQYSQVQNGIKIKSEPGMEPQGLYGVPQVNLTGNPTHDPQLAAMRAQQNIAQKFGPQLQARPSGLVLPGMNPGPPPPQHQRPVNGQHHNGIPQHDGADEEISIEGFGSLSREEADQVLLRRIGKAERERAKATEELSQALQNLKVSSAKSKAKGKGKVHRARRMNAYDEALNPNSSYPYPADPVDGDAASAPVAAPRVPQLDGDSDDGVDEDAINSDLDDSEEDEIDNDDDDEVPQIMLCMYDKVQRTKNKWKCVLKDGVLTINGQEYVFHKANGEYEW